MTKQTTPQTETYRVSYSAMSGLCHACAHEEVAWQRFESLGSMDSVDCDECGHSVDVAWVCLDGGDCYCEACAEKEGLRFIPCPECGDVPDGWHDGDTL